MFKFVMTKNSNELFHRAILYNDIKRVKLILEEALKDPRFNIDEINEEGLTGLQFSCFAGNLEVVKILVSRGANWKIRDRDGYTILHAAALAGHGEVVKYLIRTGLRPTVRTDDGLMPIDIAENIAVIVILLRGMLDQGYLQEMQDYMLDHPKLKRNIFQELEKVKCRENEKNEILKDLPYTSHSPTKRCTNNTKPVERKDRTRSTFSELSDSLQHLDKIPVTYDNNNNMDAIREEPIYEVPNKEQFHHQQSNSSLSRKNSTSSTSSHGSKASRTSLGSGGILRNDNFEPDSAHRNMQKYLENRYPLPLKSVTFDLGDHNRRSYSDGYISDQRSVLSDDFDLPGRRAYSDGYASDTFEDFVINPHTSTFSHMPNTRQSHPSEHDHRRSSDEVIYENTQNIKTKSLPTIKENHYENLPVKRNPPPLPPRMPTNDDDRAGTQEGVSDRQHGSETDSGIDINETTGRVFALSLEDQKDNIRMNQSHHRSQKGESYSQPMGLFLSQYHEKQQFFLPQNKNSSNSKYQSWNGRTSKSDAVLQPYASHRKGTSKDDYDIYSPKQQQNFYNVNDTQKMNNYNSNNNYQNYTFDETEDIML